ncbi:hypothetical protein RYX36_014222 [Vicia faba]
MPHPSFCPTYFTKDQFLQYIDKYIDHFDIKPRYYCVVESAKHDELRNKWILEAKNTIEDTLEVYGTKFLGIPSGKNSEGFIPNVSGLGKFEEFNNFFLLHVFTRDMIRTGMRLVQYFSVYIADTIITLLAKLKYGDLSKYRIYCLKDGPLYLKNITGKSAVIDVGTIKKIKEGTIKVVPLGIKKIEKKMSSFKII